MGLQLTNMIYGAYPNRYVGCCITGRLGIGKSSYALKVMYELFKRLGYNDTDAWEKTLSCCLFEIKDVVKFLVESSNADEHEYVMLWDDLRIHCGGTKYFTNMRQVEKLTGVLDSVRTSISGLLMTTPSTSGLLGVLRSYDDYIVKIRHTHEGGDNRMAIGYLWDPLPSGKRLIHKRFIDAYSCYLPKKIYDRYMIKRKDAQKRALGRLEKVIE